MSMTQSAPFPDALAEIVGRVDYRPGWRFSLITDLDRGQGSSGLTLLIDITTQDSYHHETHRRVHHLMIVPAAAYDRRAWRRWLFEQILLVERHEACEFFTIDGEKPYAPNHGPGRDPYTIVEVGTDEDRRTSYRGDVKA